MATHAIAPPVSEALHIPSPSVNGFHIGPLFIHAYALMYLVGIAAAIIITRRRWAAAGGDPELIYDVAMWSVPAGIIGGRIYFDITTPMDIPHVWYGVFAVWTGGLGIWGAIPVAVLVGIWRTRRAGGSVPVIMDAVAPALLVAQGIGRIGNYFNKELFGGPTSLPWGLQIPLAYRPPGYTAFAFFQPTFLYELIWDVALAAALVWLGHHRRIFAPGLFALYVAGYSAFRIFEESLRVDSSKYFLGLRLNMYVACVLTVAGLAWFVIIQRRARRAVAAGRTAPELAAGGAQPSRVGATDADGALTEAIVPADPVAADAVQASAAEASAAEAGVAEASAAEAGAAEAGAAAADSAKAAAAPETASGEERASEAAGAAGTAGAAAGDGAAATADEAANVTAGAGDVPGADDPAEEAPAKDGAAQDGAAQDGAAKDAAAKDAAVQSG
jgi:prolipoprotein diacylglyceryl transferase